jgi:hypothetical protein
MRINQLLNYEVSLDVATIIVSLTLAFVGLKEMLLAKKSMLQENNLAAINENLYILQKHEKKIWAYTTIPFIVLLLYGKIAEDAPNNRIKIMNVALLSSSILIQSLMTETKDEDTDLFRSTGLTPM